jgi:hypothetical protein
MGCDDAGKREAEPDPTKWCGALLASARGAEVECNLPKYHTPPHDHIYAEDEGGLV